MTLCACVRACVCVCVCVCIYVCMYHLKILRARKQINLYKNLHNTNSVDKKRKHFV